MIGLVRRAARSSLAGRVIEGLLAIRALLFVGRRYVCPCCGWRLRAFTHGGSSLRTRPNGYCPRCNAKARHRRDWLYLRDRTGLFTDPLRLLHISPKYSLSRRFVKLRNLDYVAGDIEQRPHVDMRLDATRLPFADSTFDAAICIHVLEHIEHDRSAMSEIHRVLRPGGWAMITVPIRLDRPTYEDRSITTPADRLREFGEVDHWRYYGSDFVERLEAVGFDVEVDKGTELDESTMAAYGLLDDEHVFLCRKRRPATGD